MVYIHWSVSKWAQIAHTGLANEFTVEASGKRVVLWSASVQSHHRCSASPNFAHDTF
jgi:hypothetical protein